MASARNVLDEKFSRDFDMNSSPIPVVPSASTAPRCQMACKASMAESTTARRFAVARSDSQPRTHRVPFPDHKHQPQPAARFEHDASNIFVDQMIVSWL